MVFFMFFGMFLCLPCIFLHKVWLKAMKQNLHSHGEPHEQSLLLPPGSPLSAAATLSWFSRYDAVLIPTLFDLLATFLMNVGLLYVSASTFTMVRGSEVKEKREDSSHHDSATTATRRVSSQILFTAALTVGMEHQLFTYAAQHTQRSATAHTVHHNKHCGSQNSPPCISV